MEPGADLGGLRLAAARRPVAARVAARGAATPWSFALLLLFILTLYANAALLLPALAPLAPAQGLAVAALALLFVERALGARGLLLAWPESHLLVAFLGAGALSALGALWPRHALEETLTLAKFLVVYLLIVNTVESWRRLRVVVAAMAVGGLFPALGALRRMRAGELVEGDRAAWIGIFSNPNDLAFTLVLLFPPVVALALATRGRSRWRRWGRWLLAAALAAYAAAILATYSRGGLVAFAVVAALCLWRFSPPWSRLPVAALAAVAAPLAVAALWGRDEGLADLLADATLRQRLETVRAGLAMFADRPLLGVGLGCSVLGWPLYAAGTIAVEGWLHSHNTFVQVLSETGIAGAVPFALALVAALWKARRTAGAARRGGRADRARLAASLEIALWGFLVCGLGGGYALSWQLYLLLGLVSATAALPAAAHAEDADAG